MSDDLREIFKEEAEGYINGLNDGLMKLELSSDDDKPDLLKSMNRMAHSMKGAARAVGLGLVETISHYMEEIFEAALNHGAQITPEVGDALYDGIDLIERAMADETPDDEIVAAVLHQLEATVAAVRMSTTDADTHTQSAPKHLRTSSNEFPAIAEDTNHIPAMPDTADANAEQAGESGKGDSGKNELLDIFWVEVTEHLATLNDSLLQVEMAQGEQRSALLQEMNRVAHSMKGASRAVGFNVIETISHYMEEVFEAAQNGKINMTPQIADVIYDGLDLIQNTLNSEPDSKEVVAAVLMQLERLTTGRIEQETRQSDDPLPPDAPVPPSNETPTMQLAPALLTSTVEMGRANPNSSPTILMRPAEETIRVAVSKLDQLMADSSEILVARMQGEERQRRLEDLRRKHVRWQREWRGVRSAYIRLVRRMQDENTAISSEMSALFKFLENNQRYLQEANRELAYLGQALLQDNMQLSTLADELQSDVSQLRMMPFETIVGGFQRLARDMARDLNKQVHLDIIGAGVDIDKTVLDALKDPLMHLLRNAIDHGLEDSPVRQKKGKPPSGRVTIVVEQRGSEIAIEVSDDGRGLDPQYIRAKATKRGLLTEQEAQNLTDEEARLLIFQSGFSTSDMVTALSGRGLGMDIVRNRVESLRGRVSVRSTPDEGTAITINVPVSLTRIRVITLHVGSEEYAIPSVMVERMETIFTDEIFTAEGHEMAVINDKPTPLVSMGAMLGVPNLSARDDEIQLLVLQSAERTIAFEVDALYSEIELVLKPLGTELRHAPFVAGAALTGSGNVIIVLDANDMVRAAVGSPLIQIKRSALKQSQQMQEPRPTRVLVVDDSITTRTLEKNILEAVGFEVHVAIDGAEAWSRIAEIEPDVVVSDVEMPHMNGLELTQRIKEAPGTKHVPVILLTSLSKPEQLEAGLKAGADAYLIKSRFDQSELLEVIRSVLY